MENCILYCDVTQDDLKVCSSNIKIVSSPMSCIKAAADFTPSLIIIRFPCEKLNNRSELITLCTFLRQSQVSDTIPIAALIKYYHRLLLTELNKSGVEYVDFWDGTGSLEDKIEKIGQSISMLLSPADYLDKSCPYLIYEKYTEYDEIILCEAYRSRLVINNLRLESLCSKEKHKRCDYFINPRFKS